MGNNNSNPSKNNEGMNIHTNRKRRARELKIASKTLQTYPTTRCYLRLLKLQRLLDFLTFEDNLLGTSDVKLEQTIIDDVRGHPIQIGTLEEFCDEHHAIVSSGLGPEYYVLIRSFVDRDLLEPGCTVMLHNKDMSIIGVLEGETDPLVNVMKLDKAPTVTYADIGGLDSQIREIKESVELPLTNPELFEDMGIQPPKGVILYGLPGTGKTLLAKAVANKTSATFVRIAGSELIQKYLGEGPRLVRETFRVADLNAPSIIFIDEIDAIGKKRTGVTSSGGKEVQRTMLELLNQLDGFDKRNDIKVIMATNRIEDLDPALIRPGRIDRKIEFTMPDTKTKARIFGIHTSRMSLDSTVEIDKIVNSKEELSGADIKAICSEAGLIALRERRRYVSMEDFYKAKDKVLQNKKRDIPYGLYA